MYSYISAWLTLRGARCERGASAVEYALMVVSMGALIVTMLYVVGKGFSWVFEETLSDASVPSTP